MGRGKRKQTLWLTSQPPFDPGVKRYLCSNQHALGAAPDLHREGIRHVRGGFTIATAPTVQPLVKWGGGNVDCEYFRLPLRKGRRISIKWNKLAGGCCMHFYLWPPSVTDDEVEKATQDELNDRHPQLSLEVHEGSSTVTYLPSFTGRAALQVGDGNGTATDPYWFYISSGRDDATVSGTVTCAHRRAVVGVYVRGRQGHGGFARRTARDAVYAAGYSFTFRDKPERFQVAVGCGGTPQHWHAEVLSGFVDPGRRDFFCDDRGRSGRVYNGCRLVSRR